MTVDVTAGPGLALPATGSEHEAWRAALDGPGLRGIIAERREQLAKGYDGEHDALLPLDALPRRARDYLDIANDCLRGINGEQDLKRAARKLAQAGALIMAAIDRVAVVRGAAA